MSLPQHIPSSALSNDCSPKLKKLPGDNAQISLSLSQWLDAWPVVRTLRKPLCFKLCWFCVVLWEQRTARAEKLIILKLRVSHRLFQVIQIFQNILNYVWMLAFKYLNVNNCCAYIHTFHSLITLQPKTGCPLKLSRVELVSTWMGDLLGKLSCCWKSCWCDQQWVLTLQSVWVIRPQCSDHWPLSIMAS